MTSVAQNGCFFLFFRPWFYEHDGAPPPLEAFADQFTPEKKKKDIQTFLDNYSEPSYNFKREIHFYVMQDVR